MENINGRKFVVRTFILFGVLTLAFGIFVGISIVNHVRLIEGEPIAKYSHPTEALIVIDVQRDLTSPNGKAPINPSLTNPMILNINMAVDRAHAMKRPVVYVRHEFKDDFLVDLFTGGALKQGTEGAEIDPRVHMVSDHVFVKNVMDSFSNPDFDRFLRQNQVSSVVLAGVDAAACVDAALRSALQRRYEVTVLRNGIATSSREGLEEKLKEFEALGANTLAAKEAFSSQYQCQETFENKRNGLTDG